MNTLERFKREIGFIGFNTNPIKQEETVEADVVCDYKNDPTVAVDQVPTGVMLDRLAVDIVKEAKKDFKDSTLINQHKLSIIEAIFEEPKVVMISAESKHSSTKRKTTTTTTKTTTTVATTTTTTKTTTKATTTSTTQGTTLTEAAFTTTSLATTQATSPAATTTAIMTTTTTTTTTTKTTKKPTTTKKSSRCSGKKRGGCHFNAKCYEKGKKCRCRQGYRGDGVNNCAGMFYQNLVTVMLVTTVSW